MSEQNPAPVEAITPVEFITTAGGADMIMSGPLAQAYSEGLNELYAKERTEGGVALESQQQDIQVRKTNYAIAKKPLLDTEDRANMSLFYGVQKAGVQIKHVIDVVDALSAMSDKQRKRSVVI